MILQNITYNLNHANYFLKHKQFDALTLYYLLKITHTNSVIYNQNTKLLFLKLKKVKYIPKNFTYKRFINAFNFCRNNNFVTEENNHFVLSSVHEKKGYYKGKITYNKNTVNWNILRSLLVKQGLLYSKLKQEKIISLRNDVTTQEKKGYNEVKRALRLKRKHQHILTSLGASYSDKPIFTYRSFAKKYNIPLTEVYTLIKWLKMNNEIRIKTVVKRLEIKVFTNLNLIKDVLNLKSYCYVNGNNNLIAVIGSEMY